TTWCQDIADTLWSPQRRTRSAASSARNLARGSARELLAHGSEDAPSLRTRRQMTELLGVGLHGLASRRMEVDLRSHRAGDAVERVDGRVGVGAFELGDRGLADAGELGELGLGQAQVVAHPAQLQLHGGLRLDGYPDERSLAGLGRAPGTRREHA